MVGKRGRGCKAPFTRDSRSHRGGEVLVGRSSARPVPAATSSPKGLGIYTDRFAVSRAVVSASPGTASVVSEFRSTLSHFLGVTQRVAEEIECRDGRGLTAPGEVRRIRQECD